MLSPAAGEAKPGSYTWKAAIIDLGYNAEHIFTPCVLTESVIRLAWWAQKKATTNQLPITALQRADKN